MATTSHEPSHVAPQEQLVKFLVAEMWASLAISVIWLAVLFDAVYGPDIVTRGVAGDGAVIPSAVVVSVFAFFATWVVAKYGFQARAGTDIDDEGRVEMTTIAHDPPSVRAHAVRRYEYKVIDTGKHVEDEAQRAGCEGLASGRRDDEEAALHRPAPGDHPHA